MRSKNAGPFRLTVDMLFKSDEVYRRVKASRVINPELICGLYHLQPSDITDFVEFDPGRATSK